jgi:2-hydroxychromene-2-carboxylate isomerase
VPSEAAATIILAVLQHHVDRRSTGAIAASDLKDLISARATLHEIVKARGHNADAVLAQAASAEVAALYIVHSQEAIARGVFGAPTYVLNDELFWGQDRLDFLDRALARA